MAMIAVLAEAVHGQLAHRPRDTALLVGLSGIDGSGKGYVTEQLREALTHQGWRVAAINVDRWLNLPALRYDPRRPAENFYENALRLDELFARLIVPLRANRGIRLTMEAVEETAVETRSYTYDFEDLDVILLEGIFLFKRAYRPHFDLAIWIDCSWQTALERSIQRAQEGLPPDATTRAYHTIYFPAEAIHLRVDDPRGLADRVVSNDAGHPERVPAGAKGSEHAPTE
jgi:uridine kinase